MNEINKAGFNAEHYKTRLLADMNRLTLTYQNEKGNNEIINNSIVFCIDNGIEKEPIKILTSTDELKQWKQAIESMLPKEDEKPQDDKPKFSGAELASYLLCSNNSKDELLKALRQIYMSYSENAVALSSDAPIAVGTMQDDLLNIRTFIEQIEELVS